MNEKTLVRPIVYEAPNKTPEEKMYIVLYVIEENIEQEYDICIGRDKAFEDIINCLIYYNRDLNLDKSKVLVETKQTSTTGDIIYFITHPNDSLSIKQFVQFCLKEKPNLREQYGDIIDDFYDDSDDVNNVNEVDTENKPFYKQYMNSTDFYSNTPFIGNYDSDDTNNV